MADKEEKEEGGKSGGGLLPIINLVLLVLVLAVGGFIAWKLMSMEQPAEQATAQVEQTDETKIPEADAETDEPPIEIALANVTVNLADEDQRFLNTEITLVVRNEEGKTKIDAKMKAVMDLINTTLRSKKFADIRTPTGTFQLKEDLKWRINNLVGGNPVKNVLFTKFVSQ